MSAPTHNPSHVREYVNLSKAVTYIQSLAPTKRLSIPYATDPQDDTGEQDRFNEDVSERAEIMADNPLILAEWVFGDVAEDVRSDICAAVAEAVGLKLAAPLKSAITRALLPAARYWVEAEWLDARANFY